LKRRKKVKGERRKEKGERLKEKRGRSKLLAPGYSKSML